MELIRDFNQLTKNDVVLAGGKGASLGEMTQAGIPVPPGFVLLSHAFERFIEETDLLPEIDTILHSVNHKEIHTVEQASQRIKSLILSRDMPTDISFEIEKYFNNLGAASVAIRSSATAEDGTDHAWAGQLDSYLNINKEHVLEKVQHCWASLFTPRAIFYRFEKGLHNTNISVAVVIQKMINSEMSGIAFSVHPVTENYNQLIIEAGFGLGEAIVSGQVTPDSYVVEKSPRRIIEKNVITQTKQLVRDLAGGSTWVELGDKGKEQVLTENRINELSELVIKIENLYGFPCDIEWVFEDGKFYIVQSRPITTFNSGFEISTTITENEYVRMFEFTRIPALISEVFLRGYEEVEVYVIFDGEWWSCYISKSSSEETKAEGFELYKTKERIEKFKNSFHEFRVRATQRFEEIVSKKAIDNQAFTEFMSLWQEMYHYYRRTEFFYVDGVFGSPEQTEEQKALIEDFGNFKFKAREMLNEIWFSGKQWYVRLSKILSQTLHIPEDDIAYLQINEVLQKLEGGVEAIDIVSRKKAYTLSNKNGNITYVYGDKALSDIARFKNKEESSDLRGTVANRGIVRGVARLLIFDASKPEMISKITSEIQEGDILCAETTSPEWMPACQKAGALITAQGGLLSHAAIVSRELKIPCIVGVSNILKVVKNGDTIEVDAERGVVRILK